jgi:hypothetical protein
MIHSFLDNKYTKWYFSIIANAKTHTRVISETHHIIPKSIGGDNSADNLVNLSPREHLICHLLLTKMTEHTDKIKMYNAAWIMSNRFTINSKLYDTIRRENAVNRSAAMTGPNNYFFGKTHTDASKHLISETHSGRKLSDDHKRKISKSSIGKLRSAETKLKISQSKVGKPRDDETKKKLSESHTGKKRSVEQSAAIKNQLRYECPHCKKHVIKTNFIRWHGDNCNQGST